MIELDNKNEYNNNDILQIDYEIELLKVKKDKINIFKKTLTFGEQVIYELLNSNSFLTNEDLAYESRFYLSTVIRHRKNIRKKYKDIVLK